MFEILLILAVIYLFCLGTGYVQLFKVLYGHRFRLRSSEIVEEIPKALLPHFNAGADELRQLGFEHLHYECRQDPFIHASEHRWVQILVHIQAGAFAELTTTHSPDAICPLSVAFINYDEQTLAVTLLAGIDGIVYESPYLQVNEVDDYCIATRWENHQHFIDKRDGGKNFQPLNNEYLAHWQQLEREHVGYLHRNGKIAKDQNGYRLSLPGALSLCVSKARQFKTQMQQRQLLLQKCNTETIPDLSALEAVAYRQHGDIEGFVKYSPATKWILFGASAIVFICLFGILISWKALWALVPVLLFHELGHIIAMRLFGYRDLLLLFNPLGAVAIGRAENTSPWKEAIILLAGPLPGILLACAALWLVPERAEWLDNLIYISLFLNLFNLLPLKPLDGGQLMGLILYNRSNALSAIMHAFSFCLLLAAAIFTRDSLFIAMATVSAVWLFLVVRNQAEVRKLKSRLRDKSVESAFLTQQKNQSLFVKKLQTVRNLVNHDHQRPQFFSPGSACIAFCVYALVLVTPVYVVYTTLSANPLFIAWTEGWSEEWSDEFGNNWTDEMMQSDYWHSALLSIDDDSERLSMLIEAFEFTQDSIFLDQAFTQTENMPNLSLVEETVSELISKLVFIDRETQAIDVYDKLVASQTDQNHSTDSNLYALVSLSYIEDDQLARRYIHAALETEGLDPCEQVSLLLRLSSIEFHSGNANNSRKHTEQAAYLIEGLKEQATYLASDVASAFVQNGNLDRAEYGIFATQDAATNGYYTDVIARSGLQRD